MNKDHAYILTINGGSSTIRFALFQNDESLMRLLHGKIDRIGLNDSKLTFNDGKENQKDTLKVVASDPQSAANFLIDWLEGQEGFSSVRGSDI